MITGLYGYLIAIGLGVIALVASYFKGHSNAKTEIETKQVKQKLEDIKTSERINHEVDKIPDADIDRKLSKWMRD